MSLLVVAAHPDDEALGCGGTLLAHKGHAAVLYMSSGVGSREGDDTDEAVKRSRMAYDACSANGWGFSVRNFPDNKMDSVPLLDIVKAIEDGIKIFQPSTILTHHAGDLNVDHRIVHQAVLTACRPQRGHPVKKIMCFEVPSSTEWSLHGFNPTCFVDVSEQLEGKRKLLKLYESELRPHPHPRSMEGIEALMRLRGATIGVEYAEAFVVAREIQ